MRYLIMNRDGKYIMDSGAIGNLHDHLSDLRRWGNTPDFWDGADDITQAVALHVKAPRGWVPVIVDSADDYKIVPTAMIGECY